MTGTIRLVLGDQLSRSLSGLAGLDKKPVSYTHLTLPTIYSV